MGQGYCSCHKRSPKNSDITSNINISCQNNSDDFQDNKNERNKIINDLNTLDKK